MKQHYEVYLFIKVIFLVNDYNGEWDQFFYHCCLSNRPYNVLLNISTTHYCLLLFLIDLQMNSQRKYHVHWPFITSRTVSFAAHRQTDLKGCSKRPLARFPSFSYFVDQISQIYAVLKTVHQGHQSLSQLLIISMCILEWLSPTRL